MEKFLELGCDGIKLIDMHPEVIEFTKKFISHPSYDAMFSLLEERGTPVLLHANDPKECWEMPDNTVIDGLSIYRGAYYGKNLPSFDDIYNETLKVVKKHPNLNFIIAHFFFLSSDIDRAVYVMETYPNVRFDLTPGTDMFFHFMKKPEKWHDFFTKYQDRILFGTDSNTYKDFNKEINQLVYTFLSHDYTPFTMPCYGNFTICGLGLSQEVLNKICYTNYLDVTGHEIKPVNVEGIYEAAYSIYKEMKEKPNDPQYGAVSKIFKDLSLDPKQQIAIDFFERLLNESSSSNPMQ